MSKSSVSYEKLFDIIDDFRKENNNRFDRIEAIFAKHCEDQNTLADKYIKEYKEDIKEIDNRMKPLEKLADRALFTILFLGGIFALVWEFIKGFLKKQFNI